MTAGSWSISALAVDAASVYWTTNLYEANGNGTPDCEVMKVPLAGGTPMTLYSDPKHKASPIFLNIAVDATSVYWMTDGTTTANYSDGTIRKVPLAGGTPTTLASGPFGGGIAIEATSVYSASNSGAVMRFDKQACQSGMLRG